MTAIHEVAMRFHVVFGFTALAAFWIAALTPKGSPTHRKAGLVYVAAMLLVVASALVMAVLLAIDPQRHRDFTGVRPEEVAGVAARLRGVSAFFGALALLLYLLNVAVVAPLVWLGLRDGEPLLLIFAAFCLMTGAGGLWSCRRVSPNPRDWLLTHLSNMIATGIAAHTAFLAVGAVRWFPHLYSYSPPFYVIPWIVPALLGTVAIKLLKRHYWKNPLAHVGDYPHDNNSSMSR